MTNEASAGIANIASGGVAMAEVTPDDVLTYQAPTEGETHAHARMISAVSCRAGVLEFGG